LEESDPTNGVLALINTPGGLMLSAQNGLFRYDGKRLVGEARNFGCSIFMCRSAARPLPANPFLICLCRSPVPM
jgi:hypothetical protein